MATTIKLKNGSGAPLASDLVQGEPALDLTNKRLYTEDSGGTVIEIGTTPTSLNTTGTVTFGNLSDGTITVTAFVDEDNMASNSATLIPTQQSVKAYVDSQVASADTLAELTDTNITTPADGALLFYDTGTSKWIDNAVSGDITIADTGVAAIEAGVIVNADVNASAAIDVSKTALTAGTGLTLTTNTLSVDASQTQITSVGTLSSLSVSGTITSGDITVSDGTPFIRLQDSDITNGYTQVANTNGNGYIGARNDTADGIFAVGGYGGGTFTEWARWNTTGKLIQNYDLEIQGAFTSLGIDDNATSTAITINSSENVGIGTTNPSDGKLQIAASATAGVFVRDSLASAAAPYIRVQGQRQDANVSESFSGGLVLEHYRTDAAIVNNKALGTIYFGGNHTDGSESNIAYGASIVGKAEGTFNSASDMPTGLAFFTGSTGRALGTANVDYGDERMRIDSSGVVSFSYGISEQYNAVSDSSGTTTVDLSTGTNFSSTLSANTTFAFTNPAASGKVSAFTLKIVQDASASGYTVTWPASVDWPSATAPTLTATASAVDYFVFITHDGGTTWYGFTAGQALG